MVLTFGELAKEILLWKIRNIPLSRAAKVLKKADRLYESQGSFEEALEKLRIATAKMEVLGCDAGEQNLSGPMGELLLAASNIPRLCKLPQEQILDDKIDELIDKFV